MLAGGGGGKEPSEVAGVTQGDYDGSVAFLKSDSNDKLDFAKARGAVFSMTEEGKESHKSSTVTGTSEEALLEPLEALALQVAMLATPSKQLPLKKATEATLHAWKELKFCKDGLAMATERSADALPPPFWIPANSNNKDMVTVWLPRMLNLSKELVLFCLERARTGEDIHEELGRLIGEGIITKTQSKMARHWCLVAMQLAPNKQLAA